jgi:hypothetical protein
VDHGAVGQLHGILGLVFAVAMGKPQVMKMAL